MARHIYRCPLRWSDMDAFGHVNNVVFVRYLEEARIDFMFRLARSDGSPSFSGGSVVARHEIDYVRPLVHRHEPVVVESWVTKINAASLTIAYEIRDERDGDGPDASGADASGAAPETAKAADGGTGARSGVVRSGVVYARASTVVVPYDLQAQRPRRLTDEERTFLRGYLDDADASEALVA